MITNFEEITEDLTEKELQILPYVIEALALCTTAQKSHEVCDLINMLYYKKTDEYCGMVGVRLRKFVSHIRSKGLLPIIATSQGYFVTYDKEEIKKQIKSLGERSRQIAHAAKGLEKFII